MDSWEINIYPVVVEKSGDTYMATKSINALIPCDIIVLTKDSMVLMEDDVTKVIVPITIQRDASAYLYKNVIMSVKTLGIVSKLDYDINLRNCMLHCTLKNNTYKTVVIPEAYSILNIKIKWPTDE